jgi:hypothetical protein
MSDERLYERVTTERTVAERDVYEQIITERWTAVSGGVGTLSAKPTGPMPGDDRFQTSGLFDRWSQVAPNTEGVEIHFPVPDNDAVRSRRIRRDLDPTRDEMYDIIAHSHVWLNDEHGGPNLGTHWFHDLTAQTPLSLLFTYPEMPIAFTPRQYVDIYHQRPFLTFRLAPATVIDLLTPPLLPNDQRAQRRANARLEAREIDSLLREMLARDKSPSPIHVVFRKDANLFSLHYHLADSDDDVRRLNWLITTSPQYFITLMNDQKANVVIYRVEGTQITTIEQPNVTFRLPGYMKLDAESGEEKWFEDLRLFRYILQFSGIKRMRSNGAVADDTGNTEPLGSLQDTDNETAAPCVTIVGTGEETSEGDDPEFTFDIENLRSAPWPPPQP